jgi:Domain of Unknown Function (DUF1206)
MRNPRGDGDEDCVRDGATGGEQQIAGLDGTVMTTASATVRQAANSRSLDWLARLGLAARGLVYVLIGVLAFRIAFGNGGERADQQGAFQELAQNGAGKALLWVVALGFIGYAAWLVTRALWGYRDKPAAKRRGHRVVSAVRAVVYFGLAALAVKTAVGSGGGNGGQTATAKLLGMTGGRAIVVIAGLVVIGVGVALAAQGVRREFEDDLALGRLSRRARRAVVVLGVAGNVARGVVVGIVGGLVIAAAATFDPDKARGLDAALKTLAGQPAGPWLLSVAALGLGCFGAFSFAAARYHKLDAG